MSQVETAFKKLQQAIAMYNERFGINYELTPGPSDAGRQALIDALGVEFPKEYLEALDYFDGFANFGFELDYNLKWGNFVCTGVETLGRLKELNDFAIPELQVTASEILTNPASQPLIVGSTSVPVNKTAKDILIFAIHHDFTWYFDLNPPPGGKHGQIVCAYLMPGAETVYVVADGFAAFMGVLADAMLKADPDEDDDDE